MEIKIFTLSLHPTTDQENAQIDYVFGTPTMFLLDNTQLRKVSYLYKVNKSKVANSTEV